MSRRPQGEGTVYQKTDKKTGHTYWIAQLSVGASAGGKRKRRTTSAKTKKEAYEKLRKLRLTWEQEQAEQGDQEASWTVAEYLEQDFEYMAAGTWKVRTQEIYRYQLDKYILPYIGHILLIELKPRHIQTFMAPLVSAGRVVTANNCRRQLSAALNRAVANEYIPRNPVQGVKPYTARKQQVQELWDAEDVQRFISTHQQDPWFAAYYLLLTSGLRRGELLGLRWSDIRADGLFVRQTVTIARNQAIISPPKTEDSERFVDLPEDTVLVLAEHQRRQAKHKKLVGEAWQEHDLVFPNSLGAPMHPRNFYRAWRRALKQADVPHARIHDIRHLHLSRLALLGIEAKQISERAGHSTTSFTLDRYVKSFRQQRAKAALSMDELFGGTDDTSVDDND